MRVEELLKKMIRSFFIITTGIVASMYVFCLLFNPDASFRLADIGRILLMAAASDLTLVIYLSRRELDKKQMTTRTIIHVLVLATVLLHFAFLWNWVNPEAAKEVVVFLVSVMLVYVIILFTNKYRDKKLSDKLNDRLKQRYRS